MPRALPLHPGVYPLRPHLADEVPAPVDDAAPDLARIQPAAVAGVGAEHEQQGEREGGQVEGVAARDGQGSAETKSVSTAAGQGLCLVRD